MYECWRIRRKPLSSNPKNPTWQDGRMCKHSSDKSALARCINVNTAASELAAVGDNSKPQFFIFGQTKKI